MKLVIDIETVSFGEENLHPSQKEYLFRYAEQEPDPVIRKQKINDQIRYLSLYPFTAKVIVIGMKNLNSGKNLILFESEENEEYLLEEKQIKYLGLPEIEMLKFFWDQAKKAETIITFNGRCFDIPFLMQRSAFLKIKPSRNFLNSNRSGNIFHIDLLDRFTHFGSLRKFNLDFYCRSFGLDSPKSNDITGMDVKEIYEAGKIRQIAQYCNEDIRATAELYTIWDEYLNI